MAKNKHRSDITFVSLKVLLFDRLQLPL